MENNYGTARLQTLSLIDLQKGLSSSREQLLDICRKEGFFYLEVDHNESPLGKAMKYLMDITRHLFDVPDEEKRRYPFQTTGRGNSSGYAQSFASFQALFNADRQILGSKPQELS
jgi:isopenicillin N synthase-like dioxygenase